jgi:hypothetical protein
MAIASGRIGLDRARTNHRSPQTSVDIGKGGRPEDTNYLNLTLFKFSQRLLCVLMDIRNMNNFSNSNRHAVGLFVSPPDVRSNRPYRPFCSLYNTADTV